MKHAENVDVSVVARQVSDAVVAIQQYPYMTGI